MARSTSGDSGEPPDEHGRGTGIPHPVDVFVGSRVRARRMYLGMNQETLAAQLGLTFQQVQKYESGANRVSASRLQKLAQVLGVTTDYFFPPRNPAATGSDASEAAFRARMQEQESVDLARYYYGISDPAVRQQFLDLVKAVGQSSRNAASARGSERFEYAPI